MESKKIDPYKVLNIKKDFTAEQLKEAYRIMALKVHPDKGGSDYLFKLVTLCYKSLVKEYNARIGDKQYCELKSDYKKYTTHQSRTQIEPPETKSFNLEKFNKIFDENRTESVNDTGYGSFLKNTPAIDEPKRVIKKFTQESFNSTFEKYNNSCEQNKHLIKYKEPEPLLTSKTIAFTEIGKDSIDDFSGDNTSKKNLNYMDLKIAHTTSRIVDPKTVIQRKEYKSIDDYEADRSQISYHMNDSDKEYYEKMKRMETLKEKQRLQYIAKQDQQTAEQFEKLHRLMLGR